MSTQHREGKTEVLFAKMLQFLDNLGQVFFDKVVQFLIGQQSTTAAYVTLTLINKSF